MELLSLLGDWIQFEATHLGCFESDIYSMVIVAMIGTSSLCLGMWRACVR